jgi:hypothetical protein
VEISLFVTGRISFAAIELLYEVAAKFMIDNTRPAMDRSEL